METSYKEKYEQAIERLKQWDREHPCAGYVLSDRDKFIFPELAESRDEKIKKRITLCLEECVHSDVIRDYEKDECIAWLENIQYTIDHEKREGFHLGYRACLEKRGEQKPADSYCQENCRGFQETGKCFADGECKAKREAEQKPEENKGNIGGISANWSEEDEAVLDALIRRLEGEDVYVSPHLAVECLKSLKDRVQPKQEWNEQEQIRINRIVGCLENLNVADNDILLKDVDWLKSLKERIGGKV